MAKPTLTPVLIVSTAHISRETANLLQDWGEMAAGARSISPRPPRPPLPMASHTHGWWIYCDEEPGEDLPADLITLMVMARALGAEYVNLDADAPKIEELPTYEW